MREERSRDRAWRRKQEQKHKQEKQFKKNKSAHEKKKHLKEIELYGPSEDT